MTALCYAAVKRQLISSGEDAVIVFWDMTAQRKEVSCIPYLILARNFISGNYEINLMYIC